MSEISSKNWIVRFSRSEIIVRRPDTRKKFFLRTIAAQIHFLGFLLAVIGLVVFLSQPIVRSSFFSLGACIIYSLSAMLVFGVSSLYHLLHDGFQISERLQDWFEDMDHFSIYIFIGGCYTAFLNQTVTSAWKGPLIAGVWILAMTGILYTQFKSRLPLWLQHRWVYTTLFVTLGWFMLIRIGEISRNLSSEALTFLLLGGVIYTLGAVVYATKWPRLFRNVFGYHELWHLLVVFGYSAHYLMIYELYVP